MASSQNMYFYEELQKDCNGFYSRFFIKPRKKKLTVDQLAFARSSKSTQSACFQNKASLSTFSKI